MSKEFVGLQNFDLITFLQTYKGQNLKVLLGFTDQNLMMKNYLILFVVCFITNLQAEVKLFNRDDFIAYKPEDALMLLEKMHQEDPEKSILLYIHGRGRDVREEWDAIHSLEKNYQARVLMFDWPSWSSLLSRPVKNAEDSAIELFKVFNAVKTLRKEVGDEKKISLLTHSMGNIVISHFIKKFYVSGYLSEDGKPLLDNFIAAAPDVSLTGHAEWLKKFDFARKKYVFMNNRDLILLLSYLLDVKERNPYFYKLGLGFQNLPLSSKTIKSMLDPETTYIDFSYSLKSQHRYFENASEFILEAIYPVFNGGEFKKRYSRGEVKVKNGIHFIYEDKKH